MNAEQWTPNNRDRMLEHRSLNTERYRLNIVQWTPNFEDTERESRPESVYENPNLQDKTCSKPVTDARNKHSRKIRNVLGACATVVPWNGSDSSGRGPVASLAAPLLTLATSKPEHEELFLPPWWPYKRGLPRTHRVAQQVAREVPFPLVFPPLPPFMFNELTPCLRTHIPPWNWHFPTRHVACSSHDEIQRFVPATFVPRVSGSKGDSYGCFVTIVSSGDSAN